MLTRYLYGTAAASANAVAFVEFTRKARVRQITVFASADLDADLEEYQVEISLVPYFQGNTNDSQGPIVVVNERCASGAAGTVVSGINLAIPMDIEVDDGQRFYLNFNITGTGAVRAGAAILYV